MAVPTQMFVTNQLAIRDGRIEGKLLEVANVLSSDGGGIVRFNDIITTASAIIDTTGGEVGSEDITVLGIMTNIISSIADAMKAPMDKYTEKLKSLIAEFKRG